MLPQPPVHWRTADHGNGMAGRRGQSSADATAPASSASPPSAKRPRLAPPGTYDSSVMNALGPLLNTGTSHSPSSAVASEVECYLAAPAVDWWHEKMNSAFLASRVSPSPRCFRPQMAWCLRILIFFLAYTTSIIFYHLHDFCTMMLLEVLP